MREAAVCKPNIAGIFIRQGRIDDAERLLQHEALPAFEQIGCAREVEQVREMLAMMEQLRKTKR